MFQKIKESIVVGLLLVGISFSIAAGTGPFINNATISFQLSARDLPSFDPFGGYPDPYVIITYQNSPNPPLKLGETSKLSDTQNPSWPETFSVIYLNNSSQQLTLDLFDDDIDADDFMGNVTIRLDEILSTFGGVIERNVVLNNSTSNNGKLIVTANVTNINE